MVDYSAMTEEEQIALAIQMSMNDANMAETPSPTTEAPAESTTSAMETEVDVCTIKITFQFSFLRCWWV